MAHVVPTKRVDFGTVNGAWTRRSTRVGRKVIQQTGRVAQLGELDAESHARAKALACTITGGREQIDLSG